MLCPSTAGGHSLGIICSICSGACGSERCASEQPPRARNGFCLRALAPGVLTGGCDWDIWALLASTHYIPGAPPCKFQQPKISPDIVQCPGEVPPENQGFLVADVTFFTTGVGFQQLPSGCLSTWLHRGDPVCPRAPRPASAFPPAGSQPPSPLASTPGCEVSSPPALAPACLSAAARAAGRAGHRANICSSELTQGCTATKGWRDPGHPAGRAWS